MWVLLCFKILNVIQTISNFKIMNSNEQIKTLFLNWPMSPFQKCLIDFKFINNIGKGKGNTVYNFDVFS